MPTATLVTHQRYRDGNVAIVNTTATITHNDRRLYHAAGKTYEYVGLDRSGNRIYRDTQKRG